MSEYDKTKSEIDNLKEHLVTNKRDYNAKIKLLILQSKLIDLEKQKAIDDYKKEIEKYR